MCFNVQLYSERAFQTTSNPLAKQKVFIENVHRIYINFQIKIASIDKTIKQDALLGQIADIHYVLRYYRRPIRSEGNHPTTQTDSRRFTYQHQINTAPPT
jgi:hypothetical protein